MSISKKYNMCKKCVMDTTDQNIIFDDGGVCNHCLDFINNTSKDWYPNKIGEEKLGKILSTVKSVGRKSEYDCILGLSGGVDSSYLALKIKEFGLKPLVIHIDAGWNSELAVSNIESIVNYCNFDLVTEVIDWEEMRNLQISYFKSGIANQDVPQDHAFFASLYHLASKYNIKYILSGGNIATEGIFPNSWHGSAMDSKNLLSIHKKFGSSKLKNYPVISFFNYFFYYPFIKKIKIIRPLNYLDYNKKNAEEFLINKVGYKNYGRKHGESLFTKVFQNYFLPKKFGYDKRKPHLSSLIVSGQINRNEALKELSKPLYEKDQLEIDLNYFCKKLKISRDEFEKYINNQNHYFEDYPNWNESYKKLKQIQAIVYKISGLKLSSNI